MRVVKFLTQRTIAKYPSLCGSKVCNVAFKNIIISYIRLSIDVFVIFQLCKKSMKVVTLLY